MRQRLTALATARRGAARAPTPTTTARRASRGERCPLRSVPRRAPARTHNNGLLGATSAAKRFAYALYTRRTSENNGYRLTSDGDSRQIAASLTEMKLRKTASVPRESHTTT